MLRVSLLKGSVADAQMVVPVCGLVPSSAKALWALMHINETGAAALRHLPFCSAG